MVPIIPAIPRSLEKRKFKEDVKNSEDGGASSSPIRPISLKGSEEAQADSAIAQTQAVPIGNLDAFDTNANLQENGTQETVIEPPEDAGEEAASAEGKSTFQGPFVRANERKLTTTTEGADLLPVHAQDFGIEQNGFRLPPPFYPKRSPPPAISTDFSPADERAIASEETSQTVEEEDGSNMSQQSSARNPVALNAAAPIFHAHPTPPTDVTTSPAQSSNKGYDTTQTAHFEQTPTDIISPIQLPYQGYESSQKISFYAPTQSSDDQSSPNHSVYQGYAYVPTSHRYSPQNHTSQQPIDSRDRTEISAPYEQYYEPQVPYNTDQSPLTLLGSQPPLTPSRTPLDTSAQPWTYPNGPPPNMPLTYDGYVSTYSPSMNGSFVRSASPGLTKLNKSAEKTDLVNGRSTPVNLTGPKQESVTQLLMGAWRRLSDITSTHVPLVEYLLQQFNVEEFADCEFTLVHENRRFEKTTWSLNSLLLAQSQKLRDLLKSAGLSKEGKMSLEIRLTDRFVTPWAMNSALRVLYGERPGTFELSMIHNLFGPDSDAWVFSMDACLAFAAAGHVLGLEIVVLKGLEVAASILDWENLERALSFGLESGPNRGTSASVNVIPVSAYSPMGSHESDHPSSINLTPPSSSTESRPDPSRAEGISSVSSHLSVVRSAQDFQTCCLQWMASNLDGSWELDPSARPLAEVDRLPATAESRSPLSKSRLSRIQFGDHPSEMHAKASDRNVLVSSIVLSLPFMALKYTLSLRSQPLSRQLHAIVKERERRRQIVLQSKSVPWSQRLAAREHEWAEVGYTEWVETTGDGQVALARTFTGIDRQVSEPSTPSRQKK